MAVGVSGEAGDLNVRSTGVEVHVDADRLRAANERFNEAVRVAELGGDHVWIALVTHHLADPGRLAGERHLDAESIVMAHVGCYVCEEPYDPRLARRRCPGEPKR